ncbi:MAG: hypothetical protein OEZ39_05365 [Gammaproteobacteria bacterium]|nr:hypothetical protein [Gammaproteobacteria bacterium]
MIVSPEQIFWLITGDRLGDKIILRLAKSRGVNVSGALRKNLKNYFNGKHKQSETTVKSIRHFISKVTGMEDASLNSNINLQLINYIEEGYAVFLKALKLNGSFICKELTALFDALKLARQLYANKDLTEENIKMLCLNDDLLKWFDFDDDNYFDIGNTGVFGAVFSLNITLYIAASFELSIGSYREKDSIGKEVLVKILGDIKNNKAKHPFAYLVYFWKRQTGKTDECMAESLGIDVRQFYRFKESKHIKNHDLINSISRTGGIMYFYFSALWLGLARLLSLAGVEIDILTEKYTYYFSLSQKRFEGIRAESG